jgi:hypothetical protein
VLLHGHLPSLTLYQAVEKLIFRVILNPSYIVTLSNAKGLASSLGRLREASLNRLEIRDSSLRSE